MVVSLRKIISVFVILSCILGMTVEIKYVDSITIPYWLIYLAISISCSLGVVIELRGTVSRKAMLGLFAIVIYLLIYIGFSRYNVDRFISAFVFFIALFYLYSYLLQKHGGFQEFMYTFSDIVLIIGLVSLFFWFFGSVLQILPGRMATTYSYAKWAHVKTYTYYYLYFENPMQNQQLLGMTIPRNCGIFTESPAFAGILLYAFCIHVFGPRKVNIKKAALLMVALLSTQSTKALIILIVVFGIRFIMEGNEGHSNVYKASKCLISIVLIIGAYFAINTIMSDKMIANNSYIARVNHLMGGVRTWLQSPIFGVGFENDNAFFMNLNSGAGENGLSMGLTVLLAYGGLYLALFYFMAFFAALRNSSIKRNKRPFLYFSLMLFINLFISNSAFGYPYLFFVSSAYAAGAQGLSLNGKGKAHGLRSHDGVLIGE